MCLLKGCNESTGSTAKKYCGEYNDTNSCAYKHMLDNNRERIRRDYKAANPSRSTIAMRLKRDAEARADKYQDRSSCQCWLGEG